MLIEKWAIDEKDQIICNLTTFVLTSYDFFYRIQKVSDFDCTILENLKVSRKLEKL